MVARIVEPQQTVAWLRGVPERIWLTNDKDVRLIVFYPFRDFYGGYLLYELGGIKYKTWIGNSTARKLGMKEVHIYGRRAG